MTVRTHFRARRKVPPPPVKETPEILELRAVERLKDREACRWQRWENTFACIYGRHVIVDGQMRGAPWKFLDPTLGWRRGREGTLPARRDLEKKLWVEVRVTPSVADSLMRRDAP
jgi:hypothetical protein